MPGRCTIELLCNKQRDITAAGLDHLRARAGKIIELVFLQANAKLATQNRAGRGDCAMLPRNLLTATRSLKVLWVRHAV